MKKIILPAVLLTLACAVQAATIMVDSTEDSLAATSPATCTLRAAVTAINTEGNTTNGCSNSSPDNYGFSDTIEFSLSAGASITVTNGDEITISKNLTINGLQSADGQPGITLDGGNSNRILSATNAVSRLIITDVKFINGYVSGGWGEGSAILFENGVGALSLENCAFEDNLADDGGIGGAVMTWGAAIISNSAFNRNTATHAGGAVHALNGVTIRNSTFSGNKIINNANYYYGGGAVYVEGGTTVINNSTFSGNKAGTNGGAVHTGSATATVSNSTFSDNATGSHGGAVYAENGSIAISNSTFSGNKATSGGGAIHTKDATAISNSTFSGNGAANGGAVYVNDRTLIARHLTLLDNTASGFGQALYVVGNTGIMTLNNSIVIGRSNKTQCARGNDGAISGSYNLEGQADTSDNWQGTATTCGTDPVSDGGMTTLNAIISTALANNGNIRTPPTQTLALPAGSPAIGAADSGNTSQMLDGAGNWEDATEDQRGVARAASPGDRSVGAYEYADTPPPAPPSGSGTPIPALPMPLLLALAALVGTAATASQRRR